MIYERDCADFAQGQAESGFLRVRLPKRPEDARLVAAGAYRYPTGTVGVDQPSPDDPWAI